MLGSIFRATSNALRAAKQEFTTTMQTAKSPPSVHAISQPKCMRSFQRMLVNDHAVLKKHRETFLDLHIKK